MNLIKTDKNLQWRIHLPALKTNYPLLREAIWASTKFDKPSLFIRGERSNYVNDNDIAQIKNTFTHANFISLPTGHWVHAEQQQSFTDVVAYFINA